MRAVALALLGLLGLGLLGLWLLLPRHAPGAPTPAPEPSSEPLVVPGEQLIETRAPGSTSPTRSALDPKQVAAAYSFDGQGTIRGHIGERAGAVFPREWDLVLEPHPYLQGRERAESRRIPFRAGERDFKVENLRLGGYLVRAEAAALNSSGADVLLVKGSPNQFVELAFSPSGWFDGSVVDGQGAPAEGVEVRLVETTTQARLDATTDAAGAYQFRALLDGDYEISFGAGGRPLGEPRLVSFRAPRLSFPVETLPPTGTLAVHVFDLLGKPASGVRVTGFGKPKGALDLRTDEQGVARLRWALPGAWELQALDTSEGLRAHGEVEVAAGADATLALRLAR
jgi:5-hydroxyisourate hydrolase-like protein (transthyretin family)